MKPAPFRYARPASVAEAISLLAAAGPGGRLLAGGQSLVPMLNMRLARPDVVVDLNGASGLDRIAATADGGCTVGAMVRHTELCRSPVVAERAPLLAAAARHIGHVAIRNRGTIGGSLAHADPAAELPAAVVALDARLRLAGPRGERVVPAGDFFRGLLGTALGPDEILLEVEVPSPVHAWGFAEIARRLGDFALAGVAAAIGPGGGARVVGFGVGDRPVRLVAAEAALAGTPLDAEAAVRAGRAAADGCDPPEDVHASAAYRRHLVTVLAEEAVRQAIGRLGRTP